MDIAELDVSLDSPACLLLNTSSVVSLMSMAMSRQGIVRALFAGVAQVQVRGSAADCYVGWGRKASGDAARAAADLASVPFLLLEDGFLRSLDRQDPALSVVMDVEGIYYDASVPSTLEHLVQSPLSEPEAARVVALMEHWRASRVSKYNGAPEYAGELPERYVLVLDQVAGDSSIVCGSATPASFREMLTAALRENPDVLVVVKVHPDAYTRGKAGHFDVHQLQLDPRIRVIAENCHLVGLLEKARSVYTVTSQVGFEALLWGKPVRCFGMPFYAGWGLTCDALPPPERRSPVSLEQLVFAALVRYSRYLDPATGHFCPVETVIDHVALQRRSRFRFSHLQPLAVVGFSRWKKPLIKRFLAGHVLDFVPKIERKSVDATPVLWGNKLDDRVQGVCLRVEDGFLRSSGLGADLITPLSWVIDDMGMYYDARTPSRLEHILVTTRFDPALLQRAARLRECIIEAGVSKYNLGGQCWSRPQTSMRVLLVPGQVENDASLRFGGCGITTNTRLLEAVREANPDAWIVYKPHPDVVSGLRKGDVAQADLMALCNEVVVSVDSMQMLACVDEVHTMTSLLGFEALMRGCKVVCYGHPFYAGWGLTCDSVPLQRRQRRLLLDELVAAALILYPVYVSRVTQSYCPVEQAVDELITWKRAGPSIMPFWRRALRRVLRTWVALGLKKNA